MLDAIKREAMNAEKRFGPFKSTHEGFGVLSEEVMELLEAIRLNNRNCVRSEAIQVAAVAYRLAVACDVDSFVERSGFDAMP